MKHYTIAEIDVTDGSWVRDYVREVTPMVQRGGGRYLARTTSVAKLEGTRTAGPLFLIIEWPSREAADAFYASDEYAPHKQRRLAGSRSEMALVSGDDVSGAAAVG